MEIQRVQFREANGEWVNVVITNESRVAHALLGAEGPVYDNLRTLYRYKPDERSAEQKLQELVDELMETKACLAFLLNTYDLWDPDGRFTFPNGHICTKES